MIRNVKAGEAFYHETGADGERDFMFWFPVELPHSAYEAATQYGFRLPEEGEPIRFSTRCDDYLATEAETIFLNSPAGLWLIEKNIEFELDGGYFGQEPNAVLVWLDYDKETSLQDAMLFKLTFGGAA